MQQRIVTSLVVLSVFIAVQGCGGNSEGRRAISGTVTLNGKPAESGSIDFQPMEAGGVSSGAVISGGGYSIEEENGLRPGKYRVAIYASKAQGAELPPGHMPGDDLPPPPAELVPPEWNTASDKTIDVKETGPFEFNFDIVTTKK